jgi:hypothetical protein
VWRKRDCYCPNRVSKRYEYRYKQSYKVTKTWSVKLEIAIFSCQIDKCGTWYANALFTKSFTMPNYQTIHILNAKKGSTRKIKHCKDKLVKDGKFRLFGNNVFWECATQRWRDVKVRHEKKYGRKDSISRLTLICKFLTLCETAYQNLFYLDFELSPYEFVRLFETLAVKIESVQCCWVIT